MNPSGRVLPLHAEVDEAVPKSFSRIGPIRPIGPIQFFERTLQDFRVVCKLPCVRSTPTPASLPCVPDQDEQQPPRPPGNGAHHQCPGTFSAPHPTQMRHLPTRV